MAGKIINRYPILGAIENLPTLLETHHPSQIIVSSLKIPLAKIQTLKQFCENNDIQLKRFTIGLYSGPQNLDSMISYTWRLKTGGPSGKNEKELSAII